MSKGLRSWVRANWVDIANRRSDGSFPKCGRSKGEKRKNYPKSMSSGQRRAAVSRKKKAERKARKGKRPNYAKT